MTPGDSTDNWQATFDKDIRNRRPRRRRHPTWINVREDFPVLLEQDLERFPPIGNDDEFHPFFDNQFYAHPAFFPRKLSRFLNKLIEFVF